MSSNLQATLAFTVFCSAKIAFTPQQDDIRTDRRCRHPRTFPGYTPYGSRSRSEIAIYNEYFSANRDPIMVFAFVVAKDGGSMARLEHMRETIRQLDYAGTNVTHRGKSFYTLCTDFCLINEPVRQFYNGLVMNVNSSDMDQPISLTFPIMDVLGKDLDLSPYFFGVEVNATDHSVKFLKVIGIQFRANLPDNWDKYDLQNYERGLTAYFQK
ncbi:hypothetical protein ANCCAN_23345 [Ancylostoma caninum]|uniref:Uncharacterized protein n=1 Tax=Ancylostoma caninum TaxID=29170 RepID=A0A368FL36_ANCCA|nr:hypothetical protein ANCCAN_23345 [Ancylostoma caninum]